MTISSIEMTARQYAMLGEDPPGVRLELIEGEIIASPRPTPRHSVAATELVKIPGNHVVATGQGQVLLDVDTELDEFNVRRPAILCFSAAREGLTPPSGWKASPTSPSRS